MRIWGYEDMRIWGYGKSPWKSVLFPDNITKNCLATTDSGPDSLGGSWENYTNYSQVCVLFSIWIWEKGEIIPTTTNMFICSFSYWTLSVIFGQFQPLNNRYFCRLWSIFSITHVNRLVLVELEAYFPVSIDRIYL